MDVRPDPGDVEAILAEQRRYYEARSSEYLDWFRLENRFKASPEFTAAWEADLDQVRSALAAWAPGGHALELAAGPGNWTGLLADKFESVVAVDASPSMLSANRRRTPANNVSFVEADLFEWRPERSFDAVFFGFWISHVPTTHWERFWTLVDLALAPGGSVFFMDNAHPAYAQRHGPGDWPEAMGARRPGMADPSDQLHPRTLSDGSQWTIIKRWWTPTDLERDLAGVGWSAEVENTDFAFILGVGRKTAA